jgi:polyphosphate kinase
VLVPVEHARSRQELAAVLDSVFADDSHAWTLGAEGAWTRQTPARAGKPVDHQAAMMRRAQQRARRQTDGRTRK